MAVNIVGRALLAIPVGLVVGFILGALVAITAQAFIAPTEFINKLPDSVFFGGIPGVEIGCILFSLCYWIFLIRIPLEKVVVPVAAGTYVGAVLGMAVSRLTGFMTYEAILIGAASGCALTCAVMRRRYSALKSDRR